MLPAALRPLALAALLVVPLAAAPAPAPLSVTRLGGIDYVSAIDVASRLGMRLTWSSAGHNLALANGQHRIELSSNSRETSVDGLRVVLGDSAIERGGRIYLSKIDLEHRLIPMVWPGWGGAPPPPPRLIVLDPGHGGPDHGTENPRLGLMEKTFTLDVALRLKRLLELRGYRVILTRSHDEKLARDQETDLRLRGEVAVVDHADLFISIHFNATPASVHPDTRTRGTEVYTFPPEHQRSSDSWHSHDDDSEPNSRFTAPSPINRNDHWNAVLAHAMHRELLRSLRTEDRGEKLRHLGVLRPLDCPGILVESAFLSNDSEATRVATPAFREQIAEAMTAGVQAYASILASLRPPPVPPPPAPTAPSRPASPGR